MKLLRQYSPLLPASSWPLYQEIFENEHAMATPQRTAAIRTRYLAIRRRLGRDFDSNNLGTWPHS
jgi:IS1 family transposase